MRDFVPKNFHPSLHLFAIFNSSFLFELHPIRGANFGLIEKFNHKESPYNILIFNESLTIKQSEMLPITKIHKQYRTLPKSKHIIPQLKPKGTNMRFGNFNI